MTPQNTAQTVLQAKAANLGMAAPREWKAFLDALADYVEAQRTNLVNSPLPELPVNQGRAQFGTTLFMFLLKSVEAEEKLRKGN